MQIGVAFAVTKRLDACLAVFVADIVDAITLRPVRRVDDEALAYFGVCNDFLDRSKQFFPTGNLDTANI